MFSNLEIFLSLKFLKSLLSYLNKVWWHSQMGFQSKKANIFERDKIFC